LLAVALLGSLLFLTPAGAHVSDSVSHLWAQHIKPQVREFTYPRRAADQTFMPRRLMPGQIVKGVVGGQVFSSEATSAFAWSASLPASAPIGLTDDTVIVDGIDEPGDECTGSSTNPQAQPGFVCIYPSSVQNAAGNQGVVLGTTESRWGFQVTSTSVLGGHMTFIAHWAYRAPRPT
jgi:hypothetical protein